MKGGVVSSGVVTGELRETRKQRSEELRESCKWVTGQGFGYSIQIAKTIPRREKVLGNDMFFNTVLHYQNLLSVN